MVSGAVCELIVGVKADPQFGLALVIGAGGVLAELLKDAVTLLLPTSRQEIERALGRLRIATLIDGFRGKAGRPPPPRSRAIEAVARFAEAHAPYSWSSTSTRCWSCRPVAAPSPSMPCCGCA